MTGSPKPSALYSVAIHAGAIALVLLLTTGNNSPLRRILPSSIANLKVYLPQTHSRSGRTGGGGGLHDPTPANRGSLPKPSPRLFVCNSPH
jgi:hypothetical protein